MGKIPYAILLNVLDHTGKPMDLRMTPATVHAMESLDLLMRASVYQHPNVHIIWRDTHAKNQED